MHGRAILVQERAIVLSAPNRRRVETMFTAPAVNILLISGAGLTESDLVS